MPQRTINDRRALGSMTKRHAVQWLIGYRRVRSCRSVARSQPPFSPAASLNWAGWEVLLPRLCSCLSQTCNEQRRRIAMVVTDHQLAIFVVAPMPFASNGRKIINHRQMAHK
ncbi:hypothetical protein Tsp_12988 [Trichinella spiralis]|uniref:hypothetical protein n=1 Tax=Trichinella spiralis TaxID=6334 RepID=UPI0001EFDA44|nr:hypothetical protein Tsp_12988 [Trichinella spiralis]